MGEILAKATILVARATTEGVLALLIAYDRAATLVERRR